MPATICAATPSIWIGDLADRATPEIAMPFEATIESAGVSAVQSATNEMIVVNMPRLYPPKPSTCPCSIRYKPSKYFPALNGSTRRIPRMVPY